MSTTLAARAPLLVHSEDFDTGALPSDWPIVSYVEIRAEARAAVRALAACGIRSAVTDRQGAYVASNVHLEGELR